MSARSIPAWVSDRLSELALSTGDDLAARLVLVSDFAFDALRRAPDLRGGLADLIGSPEPASKRWRDPGDDLGAALRRFRRAESVRLIARDLVGLDDVEATLAHASDLADVCIQLALARAEAEVAERHGWLRDGDGEVRHAIVFGLGKLGGGELNFSSDVDLVFAYAGTAEDSDGPRPLPADAWHARVVQRTAQLLGDITAEGFVHRVDLRLRPFGQSGKPALPLSAMEQYFQREGRDWERYAWLKARAVAGDIEAGEGFLETMRPFIYRRYLDYAAIDSLREMKAQIDLEVQRQDLIDNVKLGSGGIREVEFLVQVVQLVRGGREPSLRRRGLLPALAACAAAGYIPPEKADLLRDSYLFLRRLENRLQMLRDAQTQALPIDARDRERIALGLDYRDWPALRVDFERHRARVAGEFAQVLASRHAKRSADADAMLMLWRALVEGRVDAARLDAAGIVADDRLFERLAALARSPGVSALSARARARLDHLMAILFERLRTGSGEGAVASAVIDLLQVLLRRSNYLALLEQQPVALDRLFELAHGSRWLIRRLIEQPILLDDVFDPRMPAPPSIREIEQAFASVPLDDAETVLAMLAELRNSLHFRLGLATIDRRLSATEIAQRLAAIANGVLGRVLALASEDTARTHGWPPGASPARSGLALIGYGSLGAGELGFASDLDLVFVFDTELGSTETQGRLPVEGQRFYARVVQKLIAYMAVPLPAGRLYEIDARLRPDGAKGMLVASLDAYAAYQRERAWTWEQQALVRACFVAGDAALGQQFSELRRKALAQPRDADALKAAIVAMRERLRHERDRSTKERFDLKQGVGGLVDLEFVLQFLVLLRAVDAPALLASGNSHALIDALETASFMDATAAEALRTAHARLLESSLACTLDERPRLVNLTPDLADATRTIAQAFAAWLERD
jgi:glutamate-ammonia-ligase adenylyltransferase